MTFICGSLSGGRYIVKMFVQLFCTVDSSSSAREEDSSNKVKKLGLLLMGLLLEEVKPIRFVQIRLAAQRAHLYGLCGLWTK